MADLGFIAQGVRPVQVDTPTEAYAKQLALQNAAQEQTLRDQQIQAGKQENQQRQLLLDDQRKMAEVLQRPDVGGDFEKALPLLSGAGVSYQSIQAAQKAHAENGDKVAQTRKANADAQEAEQKARDSQTDLLGKTLLHVKDSKYSLESFGAAMNQLEYANPAMKQQLDQYRAQVAQAPDPAAAIQQITDQALTTSGVGEAADKARSERAAKDAETAKANADLPRVRAEAAIAQNKADQIKNTKPEDYNALIDSIVPPNVKGNEALNLRTRSTVQFYLQRGDVEKAQAALTSAAAEVRQLEVATDPRVAANKIHISVAENAGKNAENTGSMSDDDWKFAGEQYGRTGIMPSLGNGSSAAKLRIMKEGTAWARANGYNAADVTAMHAAYKGDTESLKSFQRNRDAVVSFEQTATKNLDQFVALAKQLTDTHSPMFNKPWREVQKTFAGNPTLAAANAARQVANNEIAKVTSGGGLSGVLSDTARAEVNSYNPADATLEQTLHIVQVLKNDMANRHSSMDATVADIKTRLANGGSSTAAAGGSGASSQKVDGRFNEKTGMIERN